MTKGAGADDDKPYCQFNCPKCGRPLTFHSARRRRTRRDMNTGYRSTCAPRTEASQLALVTTSRQECDELRGSCVGASASSYDCDSTTLARVTICGGFLHAIASLGAIVLRATMRVWIVRIAA